MQDVSSKFMAASYSVSFLHCDSVKYLSIDKDLGFQFLEGKAHRKMDNVVSAPPCNGVGL